MFAPPRPTTSLDSLNLVGSAGSNYAQVTNLAQVALSGSYTDLANAPPTATLDAVTAAGNTTTNSATFGDVLSGAYAVADGYPSDGVQSDGSYVVAGQAVIDAAANLYSGGNQIQPFATDSSISSDGAGALTVNALSTAQLYLQGQSLNFGLTTDNVLYSDRSGNLSVTSLATSGTIQVGASILMQIVTSDPMPLLPMATSATPANNVAISYETAFGGPQLAMQGNTATNLTGVVTLLCPDNFSGSNYVSTAILTLDATCGIKGGSGKPITWYAQSSKYAVTWGHGASGTTGTPLSITQLGTSDTAGANVSTLQAAVATNTTGISLQVTSHTTGGLNVQWTLGVKIIGQSYSY